MQTGITELLSSNRISAELKTIADKIYNNQRISEADALVLFQQGSLPFLGSLANFVRERLHGDTTYFNRNFHIEPTNLCVFSCNFCSYSKIYAKREEGWELSIDQMLHMVQKYDGQPVTEVHICLLYTSDAADE